MRQHEAEALYWCHGVNPGAFVNGKRVEANQSWFIDRKDRSQHDERRAQHPTSAARRAQYPDYENPDYDLKAYEQWRYLFIRNSKDFATEGEHKNYWDGVTEHLVYQILEDVEQS
jgi:hypothetical protein